MNALTKNLLDRLDAAEFFGAVGQPLPQEVANAVVPVHSWQEAVACCSSLEYENYSLEQSNQLTMFLHGRHRCTDESQSPFAVITAPLELVLAVVFCAAMTSSSLFLGRWKVAAKCSAAS